MDGVHTSAGILVIATANDLGKLKESITDRPSRFDRKWEIPLPDQKMASKYLKRWFGSSVRKKDYEEIAKDCVQNNFSYAYLKELYLTSVFNALQSNRTKPTLNDIKKAKEQLLVDKEKAKDGFTPSHQGKIGIGNV